MSHYKPYPAYKDSGVEWLGRVPEHWQVKRLKFIASVQTGVAKGKDNVGKDTIEVPYLRVANVQDGYLSLDDVTTIEIPREDLPRYSLRPGDVLMNEGGDFDKVGRGHVWKGEINPCIHQNHVFAVRPTQVASDWLNAFTSSQAAQFYFMGRAKQSTNLASISSSNVMELPVIVPPDDELPAVLSHLACETARVGELIEKKTRFVELLHEKILGLIGKAFECQESKWVRLQYMCDVISRPVGHQEEKSYVRLGLYNRGRGIFKKEETEAEDMGDSDFFWVESGDLILSGQFAWEGAVALADSEHDSCVVSHRYPIIRGRAGEVLTEYLFALLLSNYGDFLLNDCSRGSAGRNRPLNLGSLLKWKIPVPPLALQNEVATLVHLRRELLRKVEVSIVLLKERRSALITAAVTGQIDLRESA